MNKIKRNRHGASRLAAAVCGVVVAVVAGDVLAEKISAPYDPLAAPAVELQPPIDLDVVDTTRQRTIPVRIYLPTVAAENAMVAAPVVLFSHGLGGARTNNPYLAAHWAARGYAVVYVQHPGSDEAVWKDMPSARRIAAMRQAASARNFLLRVNDIPAVLDQLTEWNANPAAGAAAALVGRLDLGRVGMSGHSFGAITTQAVSGQSFARGRIDYTDPRIDAAVLMSPSSPRRGDPVGSFATVQIPWLLMTGTHDTAPIGSQTVASRRAVFPALPGGSKYELVLDGAEHSAFGDRELPSDRQPRNPNHHRAILALSTAFWDAYLRVDEAARAWLDGPGPQSVLEPADGWQWK